jgi:alcohol dehydrogenase class IV
MQASGQTSPQPLEGPLSSLQLPSVVAFGAGARRAVGDHLLTLGATKVLLVTDAFFSTGGLAEEIAATVRAAGVDVSVFADVDPDPTDANVLAGLSALESSEADAVVAVGGGSVLDAAKMIAVLRSNPQPIRGYAGYDRIPRAGVPVIAIPTTAGTGSEATRIAVITDTQTRTKMMILDRHLLPAAALVDFELSCTMPGALTAYTGIDTLVHGIEAYVSSRSGPLTDLFALSCIDLVARNLQAAWEEPDNRAAREAMALAACYGGIAFSNASVCLVHGMSRPLGAVFHVPHGLSNAVLLTVVTRFSLGGTPNRYATVARLMGMAGETDDEAGVELVAGLQRLNEQLQVPRIRDLPGVDEATFAANLDKMASDALASGSPDRNPVVATHDEIVALYREAW